MNILFLSAHPAMPVANSSQGYAVRINELTRALNEQGHHVQLLIAGDHGSRQAARQIYKLGIKRLVPPQIAQVLRELILLFLDRQFYFQCQPQVDAAAPDVILERYSIFHRTGMWLADQRQLPLVLDDIAPIWEEEIYFHRALRGLAHHIQDQVFAQADALIAVSSAIQTYLSRSDVTPQKIHVIHNGADCDRFSPQIDGAAIRARFGLDGQIVVGFVGGFLPWHGVDALLNTALELGRRDGVRFLLIGPTYHWSSTNTAFARKLATAVECGAVTVPGDVVHQAIPPYVAAMDITTMPNSNSYGSPIKIFEYMAAGKTVVAPRLPPIEEIITHSRDGWLIDPTNPIDLQSAIEYLCARSDLRQQLGAQARHTVLRRFSWCKQAERLSDVLESVRATQREVPLPTRPMTPGLFK